MSNSWDEYYNHFSDWDEAHKFTVRVELRYETELIKLGYKEFEEIDNLFISEENYSIKSLPQSKIYQKSNHEIVLSFDVPYDWSIDTDWEDKALVLLGLKDEWVIDSTVEDR
tara:strand:+ start:385 stop:720 length:336 start_codon:yes stop_codon:yes gene_type:complete